MLQCKDPNRALPIGIVGSLLIVTVFYILAALTLNLMVPLEFINETAGVLIHRCLCVFGGGQRGCMHLPVSLYECVCVYVPLCLCMSVYVCMSACGCTYDEWLSFSGFMVVVQGIYTNWRLLCKDRKAWTDAIHEVVKIHT
jgi:amino acid transporter